ncbi:hypothetical protein HN51_015345, partial [Arachis hypogaea]
MIIKKPGIIYYFYHQVPIRGSFGLERGYHYNFPNGSKHGSRILDQWKLSSQKKPVWRMNILKA